MATVKIKVKPEKIKEVLEALGKDSSSYTLELDIVDNIKESFKYLSTSEDIIDWSLEETIKENIIDQPKKVTNPNTEEQNCSVDSDFQYDSKHPDKLGEYIVGLIPGLKTSNELSTLVEAVWTVSKKSPGIVFGSTFWKTTVLNTYKEIGNLPITIDHALLKMIIETYYMNKNTEFDLKLAVADCFTKFRDLGKRLMEISSIAELANILFGNKA